MDNTTPKPEIPEPERGGFCVTETSWPVTPSPWRILLADDDKDVRQLISCVLTGAGFEVDTAADGEGAWKMIVQGGYDLLVTDNNMPLLSGIELVERMRRAGMELPVILITGSPMFQIAPNYLHLKLTALVRKPIDLAPFLSIVKTALRARKEQLAANPKTSAGPSPASKPPHQVLVVDDDFRVRRSLAALLESEGYAVEEAGNGVEAVSRAIEHTPDLVLLDLNMPHCNGWTAFSQLGVIAPSVPVIVITALPHQYQNAVHLGVDAFMEKPLNIPVLVRAIKNLTDEEENREARRSGNGNHAFATQLLDDNYS